jgi:hypothetical protein
LLLLLTDGKLSAIALSKERFIVKPKYRDRRKLKGRGQRAEGRRQRAEGFYVYYWYVVVWVVIICPNFY